MSSRLYEIIGVACGLILINYGFNIIAAGLPGTRMLTSQFLGGNLLIGGCAVIFLSLYYLLKPATKAATAAQPVVGKPDVGIELVVVEETPSQVGFYKNVEYIGLLFTGLGLFAAADLVLQVFIPQLYHETRWWVEVLLVVFGALSYPIFFSIGRIGSQEEKGYVQSKPPTVTPVDVQAEVPRQVAQPRTLPEKLEISVSEFARSSSGEYEKHLSGTVYDLFRVEKELVTVWREDRVGMRSVYLAGPYELTRKLMQDHVIRGEELKVGSLLVNADALRDLLKLQQEAEAGIAAAHV